MTTPLLRDDTSGDDAPVGTAELFFDLVFVFAVTQLSHELLDDLTPLGTLHAAILLLAVWWVWVLTTWASNTLNPQNSVVRILLFTMMGGALFLSTSMPDAFEGRAWVFATAYVALQLGRTAFLWWAHRRTDEDRGHYARLGVWLLVSSVLWLWGGFAGDPQLRLGLWAIALAIDYVAPSAGFWIPGIGQSRSRDLTVEGDHMAERVGLFILIALGESILVTGQSFSDTQWSATTLGAAGAAVLGSMAMWWIYFARHADAAAEVIDETDNPGRLARRAYTYTPVVMVAGIVVTAVGDELVLERPDGATDLPMILTLLGGPALFLVGAQLFKWVVFRKASPARLTGFVVLAACALVAPILSPLIVAWISTAVLLAVAGTEYVLYRATPPAPPVRAG